VVKFEIIFAVFWHETPAEAAMSGGVYKRSAKPGSYPDGMPIALDYDGDQFPALVGGIVACFAAIERELPGIIARVTKMKDPVDAIAICAAFRSFNSRLEILDALLKLRTTDSHDNIIYGHCKGLFKEANQIRNKYAHALYAKGVKMSMSPFHHDLKAPEKWIEMGIEDFQKDKRRISVILGELFAILHQKELPQTIYDRLLPQDRQ
jgi:hypothetical protein